MLYEVITFHDITYSANSVYEEDFQQGGDLTYWDDYYMEGSGFRNNFV